uniref:Uncharacterized protein n=1 Tax=Anguilla anguilla TaxID=7936 RepID=A0A0E9XUH1_ANGAN
MTTEFKYQAYRQISAEHKNYHASTIRCGQVLTELKCVIIHHVKLFIPVILHFILFS